MKKILVCTLAFFTLLSAPANAATYKVSKGDSLYKLSRQFNVSIASLKKFNDLSSDTILTGQILNIPSKTSIKHTFALSKPSRSTGPLQQRVLGIVESLIDAPYVAGGTTPKGFDCSGFTSYVYNQLGIKLPRTSQGQFSLGIRVDKENLQVGDLMFFDSMNKGEISHVGIYVGNNKYAHAASDRVEISSLPWYYSNYPFYGSKRIINN